MHRSAEVRTANGILLEFLFNLCSARFFYRNVWMPWNNDNDEDLDWAEKRLESRIKFCFDLKRNMSRPMADHIRVLLAEARYIQSRRELIEVEMSDDEEEMNESMGEK